MTKKRSLVVGFYKKVIVDKICDLNKRDAAGIVKLTLEQIMQCD